MQENSVVHSYRLNLQNKRSVLAFMPGLVQMARINKKSYEPSIWTHKACSCHTAMAT